MKFNIKTSLLAYVLAAVFAFSLVPAEQAVAAKTKTVALHPINMVAFDNTIYANSVETLAAAIFAKRLMLPRTETLYIVINSRGGQYEYSKVLLSFLETVPNVKLICHNCSSGAGFVFMRYSKGRLVGKTARLLMHELYLPKATRRQLTDTLEVESLIAQSDEFDGAIADTLKVPVNEYQKRVANKEWVLEGKDIVKNRLADEYITITCNSGVEALIPYLC